MIRRIILICAVLMAAISCLEKSSFTQSGTVMATFEFVEANYTELFGADSLYFDSTYKVGIGWDLLAFYHNVDKETSEFKGGFILSYLAIPESGMTAELANNEYRVNTKAMKTGVNTFVVFSQTGSMPEHDMGFTFVPSNGSAGTCVMKSCYVNNTVAVAEAVAEQFVPGDELILKATGYLSGNRTDSVEMTLAKMSTSAKDTIVSSWTAFDLSKLGSIDKVDFEMIMPDGKDIPTTVCIDNVVASVSLTY